MRDSDNTLFVRPLINHALFVLFRGVLFFHSLTIPVNQDVVQNFCFVRRLRSVLESSLSLRVLAFLFLDKSRELDVLLLLALRRTNL